MRSHSDTHNDGKTTGNTSVCAEFTCFCEGTVPECHTLSPGPGSLAHVPSMMPFERRAEGGALTAHMLGRRVDAVLHTRRTLVVIGKGERCKCLCPGQWAKEGSVLGGSAREGTDLVTLICDW